MLAVSIGVSTSARRNLLLAVGVLLAATAASVLFIDRPLAAALAQRDASWAAIAENVTWLGRSGGYLIVFGVAFVVLAAVGWRAPSQSMQRTARAWSWAALYLFLAIAISGISNDIIKLFVGRPRPMIELRDLRPFTFGYDYQSFPSGHAATAFALALALGAMMPRFRWLFLIYATAIAASRVILNAHHLGDVVASLLVALLSVHLLTRFFADRHLVFERDGTGRLRSLLTLPRTSRRITPA
jgi:undecaprenyl-diphosphatase